MFYSFIFILPDYVAHEIEKKAILKTGELVFFLDVKTHSGKK